MKNACDGCRFFHKHYGNKDKQGNRTVSNYWCSERNGFLKKFPKECKFRSTKDESLQKLQISNKV